MALTGWQQQQFIITMWCPPPATAEQLAILARDHYTHTGVGIANIAELDAGLAQFDLVQQYGLKAFLHSPLLTPAALDDPALADELAALVEAVKHHPALEGYHLTDEPSATAFPVWARLVDYLQQCDPDHLAYLNLFPTYANQQQLGVWLTETPTTPPGYPDNFAGIGANNETVLFYNEHLRQFIEQIHPRLISYDHYHFLNDGVDGRQYFLNLALIRQAARQAGVPFLNIVQACTIESVWRLVNADEMRWLAYTTLAYGGRGLSWFLYWGPLQYGGMYQDGTRVPLADYAAEINADLMAFGPELLRLESSGVYHTAPLPVGTEAIPADCPVQVSAGEFIVGLFTEHVFMVVNRDYRAPATAELQLNFGPGRLLAFNPATKAWEQVCTVETGAIVPVTLRPGDGRLFKVMPFLPTPLIV